LICSIETTIGPSSRKSSPSSSHSTEKVASTPPPSVPSPPPPTFSPSSPAKTNVLQRNLIQEDINPQTILENHQSYCSTCVETREFTHPTLVYITPWNNHGYDLVKIFTKKFDYISPVWLNIKRKGNEQYVIGGTHDIDKKWIEVLKEKNPKIKIVPRIIFEEWSVDDIHALFQSENEKQQLAITLKNFLNEYNQYFDGYVLELLVQFRGASKPTLNHIISDIAEYIHQIEGKEIILAVPPYDEIFSKNDFEILYEHLDGFSVMTYDFPNREPGPVAPLGKYLKNIDLLNFFLKNGCKQ
jgi:chitinase domain-containing protein 1